MKFVPTNLLRVTFCAAFVAMSSHANAAEGETVSSPTKRQQALDEAKKLMAPREKLPIVANPFYSEAFAEAVAGTGRTPGTALPGADAPAARQPSGPRNDRELLQAIALSLKPTGFFVLGGQPTLVFGQKRVKAGSSMTITFEGTEYTLEITAVDRTNFTLRLNREEFTRPNK